MVWMWLLLSFVPAPPMLLIEFVYYYYYVMDLILILLWPMCELLSPVLSIDLYLPVMWMILCDPRAVLLNE